MELHPEFWSWSLPERRAWFVREVMVKYLPREVLPGDLIAGARFNVMTSACLNKQEAADYDKHIYGKNGARAAMLWYHNHGFGNTGATSGHLIPGYDVMIREGWKGIYEDLRKKYEHLSPAEKKGKPGAQLRAMMTSATMARDLTQQYSQVLQDQAASSRKSAAES